MNEKNKISATIVADSRGPYGNRIISYVLTYPRMIHAELMTHRMFSRNSASSRAIPFNRMVKMVQEDPFIPIAWQKDHKGMQGAEYLEPAKNNGDITESTMATSVWLSGRDAAVRMAESLNSNSNGFNAVTKQLCNRLLEPFLWYTVLVTATEYENFFELRCPQYDIGDGSIHRSKKDAIKHMQNKGIDTEIGELFTVKVLDWIKSSKSGAEIHIQALAEAMWDARNESTPNRLESGEWHIPFGDRLNFKDLQLGWGTPQQGMVKVATARCARVSYMTFDGEIDYAKDIALHDMLLESKHMSPFEHCARAMSDNEYMSFIKGIVKWDNNKEQGGNDGWQSTEQSTGWCNNFRGFIQYRYLVESNEL